MTQPSLETKMRFMREALNEARLAFDAGETPVGAVLVCGETILCRAHNEVEARHDATAHAELLCLAEGCRIHGQRLSDCTLYVTMEPCAMCTGALINCKLGTLVFGAFDADCGCCGSALDLTWACFRHTVAVHGGLLEEECAALLSSFFRSVRK